MYKDLFKSFWMAGYECSDQMNAFGERVNLLSETGHDVRIEEDYKALRAYNIKTIREGIQWSECEKAPFVYDWSWMEKIIEESQKMSYQIIWDLCHFGYPSDMSPLHPKFPERFSCFAEAFARHFKTILPDETLLVVPFNEVSFISWLGGDVRGTVPYSIANGWHVKYAMMNAYIQAIQKIKSVDKDAVIISTEPLINITCGSEDMTLLDKAKCESQYQFQVLDILTGKICGELKGAESHLDIIGLNYYCSNQWQLPENNCLDWKNPCSDYVPLHILLREVYERYKKPIILSETSNVGEDRAEWIEMIASECKLAVDEGIPLIGICLYPIIDRPDWDDLSDWHHSGLWDIFVEESGLERILSQTYSEALFKAQDYIDK